MLRKSMFLIVVAISLGATAAHSDTLLLEGLGQPGARQSERPARGMSMDRVENLWGTPIARRSPIGDPPISRWEYDGFVVYFEYRHVIHAVVKR